MKRIVFMGTPDFAVPSLALLAQHFNVVAVVTTPDKPAGRGLKLSMSAVKSFALENNIPVLQPENLKDSLFIDALKNISADLFVVVAFRKLPEVVWKMPALGTINLHASLLPQYRGAAPINWAIINGEKVTGLTTFFINETIDTGDCLMQKVIEILPQDDFGALYQKMQIEGAQLLLDTLQNVFNGSITAIKQVADGSLHPAPKLNRDNCKIDFSMRGGRIIQLIRGLSPHPAAYCVLKKENGDEFEVKIFSAEFVEKMESIPGRITTDGKKLLAIDCQDGMLKVNKIRFSGKKTMLIDEFLRGYRFGAEDRFL